VADWFYRSKAASVLWLVARVWLGYGWLNAGYQKLWGSEKAAFWNGGGAGVKGFATAGVAGSKAGTGGASYGWFAAFLHGFVIPNASWIAKAVTPSELVIGALLTPLPVNPASTSWHRRPVPTRYGSGWTAWPTSGLPRWCGPPPRGSEAGDASPPE
jgi:uncharacterized membrane protein YphA (DoxX/SURF4 family)